MIFNKHSALEGQHAFLGASKYHWINYDESKVAESYSKFLATQKGTELHDFAARCITLGQKLPKSQKTLNMYVNDAIGFKMVPEQPLFYSENCFGTTDAIAFRNRMLRIHDLKLVSFRRTWSSLKYTLLFFVWNTKSSRPTLRWNFGSIRTTRFFTRIQRLKPSFPSWTRLSHSTK